VTQDPTVVVLSDADVVGNAAADIVAATVRANPRSVIAVPTGTTPLPMFAALIDRVTRGELDLSQIHLFCLDEYVGVAPSEPNSLTGWLTRVFIEPAGISMRNVHTLPSTDEDLAGAPGRYEADLAAHGGLDLAILGLGGNGHIAYNEPGSEANSRTRVIALTPESVAQAAGYFEGRSVPTQAMTIGVQTLLEARQIVLLVTGAAKTDILAKTLHAPMSDDVPASWLRLAGERVTVLADEAATGR
jgi:glucosamine-6-phosphate deaminase